MPTTSQLLRIVQDAIPNNISAPNDTELLQRYVSDRDEAAFAELVRRNGPLVLRTCRHILGEATAEDAFQVTFLLMARSAQRLTRSGSLAGWLHATAVQIANNTRRGEHRRRTREAAHRSSPTAPDDMTWREVREVLDVEIAALPECYRLPLVLCYLQELSYDNAAQQVGCSVGALRGRLERGKERLRKRLTRYGLPLAAPVLVVGHPPPVTASLIETTLRMVQSGMGGKVPPALASLLIPKDRLRVALLFMPAAIMFVAIGTVLAVRAGPATDPPKVDPPKSSNPIAVEPTPQPLDALGDPLPKGAIARLGTRRMFGANDADWSTFSLDGKLIATKDWNGVIVTDAITGQQIAGRRNYSVAGM
ncbi:MAG TPA: sigma-70 family RNA polymerase sigma factor, partial [Gemmata sp.]|nr:sigma-70 family RNA polymerase sigma factor [Gemmata sp.]